MEHLGEALLNAAQLMLQLPARPRPGEFAAFVQTHFPDVYPVCLAAGMCDFAQPVRGGSLRPSGLGPSGSGPSGERPSGSDGRPSGPRMKPDCPPGSGSDVVAKKEEMEDNGEGEVVVCPSGDDSEPPKCQCLSGACFSFACVARSSKRLREAKMEAAERHYLKERQNVGAECFGRPLRGFELCSRCKCGVAECSRKTQGRTRFCNSKLCPGSAWVQEAARHPNRYVTPYGVQEFGQDWNPALRATARLGWLLPDAAPLDYVAFQQLAGVVVVDGRLSPGGLVALFISHCLKWPPAVMAYSTSLRELAQPFTAENLVRAWLDAIQAVDGKPLKDMHKGMSSTGRMHAQTGIVVHSQWAGLIAKVPPTRGRDEMGATVELGASQKLFRVSSDLRDTLALVQWWIARAEQVWPSVADASSARIADAAQVLLSFAVACRGASVGSAGPLRWKKAPGRELSQIAARVGKRGPGRRPANTKRLRGQSGESPSGASPRDASPSPSGACPSGASPTDAGPSGDVVSGAGPSGTTLSAREKRMEDGLGGHS